MKKILLESLVLLCALVVGSMNVWGADVTGTINFGSASGSTKIEGSTSSGTGTVTYTDTGDDSQGNTWTITTITSTGKSFTQNTSYSQVGSSNKPATSITFTTTLASAQTIKAFSAKFGGFSNTAGTVTLKVGETSVGSGSLNGTSDVTVSATNKTTSGTVLTVTVTGISKGVKAYYISYTYENSTPTHTLTYSATNGSIAGVDGGSNAVASGASVAEGATVTLSATPSAGYVFSSWSVNGTGSELSSTSDNPTTFTMGTANATVTANFEVDNTVATPTFDPDGSATYTQAQNVTISCATEGTTIHYTTNGDDPTESDATYSSAVSITTSGTVLKAKAFKDGMTASAVASATYIIKPNKPTITATGATVTITADEGCAIYYTTDNSTPSKSSTLYTGPFNPNADCSIKTRAYDAYDNASDVRQYNYVYLPLSPKNINSNHYVKVTDVNTLENGDAVLIVCESHNVAMSTTQNTNNRGQAEVSISNNTIDNPAATVQKLVLMKKDGYFYFHTGSGYLYAASGSSNYLRTETSPDDDDNAKATITISNGDATILFQGENSVNWVKHNNSNSIFSCYPLKNTTMDIVQIYKEVPVEPTDPVASGNTVTLTTTTNMNGWRTFAPVKADQNYTTDADVYYVSTTGSSSVTLVKIEGGVPANTPVILHKTDGTTITLTETDDAITAPGASNLLAVSTADQNLGKVYRLGYKSAYGVGFYTYTTTSAPEGIVYINPSSSAHEFLGLDFDGETTGVADITNTNLTNNTNEFYNLAGQRVAQPTKGLYIVNGRKVIVK